MLLTGHSGLFFSQKDQLTAGIFAHPLEKYPTSSRDREIESVNAVQEYKFARVLDWRRFTLDKWREEFMHLWRCYCRASHRAYLLEQEVEQLRTELSLYIDKEWPTE